MSNANTPWLSLYDNVGLFPRSWIRATYPNILDALIKFEIENKNIEFKTDADRNKNEEMSDKFLDLCEKIENGKPINSNYMPSKIYRLPEEKLPDDNTIMFRISSGIFLVNQTAYDVFCEHRLGNSQFSQVYIYDIETQEKLSDTPYYFLNVAERRKFLDNQNSKQVTPSMINPEDPKRIIQNPKDDDVILANESMSCDVDVWFDPLLVDSLFFSDALAQALLTVGITTKDFGLVRCQVQ